MQVSAKSPQRWANDLTTLLNATHGSERFPVELEEFALSYSRQIAPDDPILSVIGDALPGFEGALVPIGNPRRGWRIIHNNADISEGRRRFTLAHEFGHYLLHRHVNPAGIYCGKDSVLRGEREAIEREADNFAATLLMPLDDFRKRIDPYAKATFEDLAACADRYGVSLIAATLRWLGFTHRRSLMIVSRDGYALWARSSTGALKSGRFIRTARETYEIPIGSCAGSGQFTPGTKAGVRHPAHVWFDEEVEECSIPSPRHDQVITLLHLEATPGGADLAEVPVEDVIDRIAQGGARS
ncbi:ImmA/IrrE family metallo-endopeptidase [Methylobacterium sp. A54F]